MLSYDISNPFAPKTLTNISVGSYPNTLYVSGRYAYMADGFSNALRIIDISNPNAMLSVSSLAMNNPQGIHVSGRYAYVTNYGSGTLSVVDVSIPATPVLVSTSTVGTNPQSVFVSGRYAYVANRGSSNMSIIDIGGIETTSATIHSLAAGTLNVRTDIDAGGNLNLG